jgi:hypothetical protein
VHNVLREVDDSDLDALLDTALRPQHAVRKPAVEVEESKPTSTLSALVAEEEAWLHRAREERQERPSREAAAVQAPVAAVAPVVEPVAAPPPPVAPEVAVAPAPAEPVAPPVLAAEAVTEVTPPVVAPAVRPPRSRWLMGGALLGTAVLGALAGAMVMRTADRPETVVRQPAPAPAPVAAVAPAPVAAVAPAPVAAVAPPPVAAVAPAPVAAVAPPPVAAVAPPPVAAVAPPPVAAAPEVPRPPVEKAPAVAAKKEPPVSRAVEKVTRAPERIAPRSEPAPEKKKVAAVTRSDGEMDDDFARELGFTSEPSRQKKPEQDARPESLSTSDILQVVAGHKGDVVSCIQQHSPPKPESGQGRFVVRWRLRTDGGVTDVLLEDEHLKGSPFARCIETQVRAWKFSPHRVQRREPVRFPFTY